MSINCGSIYIPIGSKYFSNGLSLKVYSSETSYTFQTVHNSDANLVCKQTFVTTTPRINFNESIIPTKFALYTPRQLNIQGTLLFVVRDHDTDEVLAFEVITDQGLNENVSNTLWIWGTNNYGQLGDGTKIDKFSPIQIGANTWKSASSGFYHTLAIRSDGTIWAWGFNAYGQLGDETFDDRIIPTQIGNSIWNSVSCGAHSTLAIRNDGTLWAWGNNNFGQLGDGTQISKNSPVQIGANTWKSVFCAGYYTLAIRDDDTLWAWGYNAFGSLGDGTTINKTFPIQIGNSTWKSISGGNYHTLAINGDGSLWAWGDNANGEIGDNTTTQRNSPVKIGNSIWKIATGGANHTMAIRNDNTLWGWGTNTRDQLGDSTIIRTLIPVKIGNDTWNSVSANSEYTLAIRSDDTLWGWGANVNGVIGDGSNIQRNSPVQIGNRIWASVFAGGHSIAIAKPSTIITTRQELDINNLSSNTNSKTLNLHNKKLQVEIYSICSTVANCCDKLPSSFTFTNSTTSIPCTTTTTTTTTTTLPPFCSSFNLPDSFYITVAGYDLLAGQEAQSLVTRSGNTWSTNGTFPCGASFTLSMTCNDSNRNFSYNGSISCCNQATKIVLDPTSFPRIFPNARTDRIVWYTDCSGCVNCTTTTTTTTSTTPPPVDCREGVSLTINGYAFYTDNKSIKNIPGIGDLVSPCYGGHVCNRTDFLPQLITPFGTINASNSISLNNFPSGGDRSATFSFNISDSSILKNGASFTFGCLSPNNNCHENTTWVVLTATIDNTTQILFNSCVLPNSIDSLIFKCENCCDWDGNTSFTFDCENGQSVSFPMIFYKIDDYLWECNQTLDCGDYISSIISCDPKYKLQKPPTLNDCLKKWSVLSFDISCVDNESIDPSSLLQLCECNKIPEFKWTSGGTSNCICCNPPSCESGVVSNCEVFYDDTINYQYYEQTLGYPTSSYCVYSYIAGQQTITIPQHIPLPVVVAISGSVNDDLLLNGEIVQPDQFPFSPFSCNGAHFLEYCFTSNSRTFTLATQDNFGAGMGADIMIKFCRGGSGIS